MKHGAAIFVTAFPAGNYAGAGAGETLSMLRLARLAERHESVTVLVCSHVEAAPPPDGPANLHYRLVRTTKAGTLRELAGRRTLPTLFHLRHTRAVEVALAEAIGRLRPTTVYFDFSQTFSLVPLVPPGVERVAYLHDVAVEKYGRAISPWRPFLAHIRNTERHLLAQFDRVVVLSEREQALLESTYGVPASVDDWERWLESALEARARLIPDFTKQAGPCLLVYYGNLHRAENWSGLLLLLVHLAWRRWSAGPLRAHQIVLAGVCPGWLSGVMRIFGESVCTTGFVASPHEWLARADMFLAPVVAGAGVKIKIKEYQAYPTPILGTALAFAGLRKRTQDREATVPEMVRAILEFLSAGCAETGGEPCALGPDGPETQA